MLPQEGTMNEHFCPCMTLQFHGTVTLLKISIRDRSAYKVLAMHTWRLRFIVPSIHKRRPGIDWEVCTCNPSTGEAETRGSPGFTDHSVSQISNLIEILASESKKPCDGGSYSTLISDLCITHAQEHGDLHTCVHINMNIYTCIHKKSSVKILLKVSKGGNRTLTFLWYHQSPHSSFCHQRKQSPWASPGSTKWSLNFMMPGL